MPNVVVQCDNCGGETVLRQLGRYFFVCRYCRLTRPIKGNIVCRGVSLKKLKKQSTVSTQTKLSKPGRQTDNGSHPAHPCAGRGQPPLPGDNKRKGGEKK